MIDQLAELLNRGWQIPLSSLRVIDANEFEQLLERMRINVPSSIMESERTVAERDIILADARAEAERVIQQAKQKAMELLSEDVMIVAARQEAERLLDESRLAARRRAEEADRYAIEVLEELAAKLQVIAKQVDNGVQVMRNNRLASVSSDDEDRVEQNA